MKETRGMTARIARGLAIGLCTLAGFGLSLFIKEKEEPAVDEAMDVPYEETPTEENEVEVTEEVTEG